MEHCNCMRRGLYWRLQNHSSLQHVHLFESESVEFKFVVLAWFHNWHILSLVFVILVDQDSPFRDTVLIGFRKLFSVVKYSICSPFKNQTFIGLPSLKGNQNIYVFAQNIEVAILVLLLLLHRHFQSLSLQVKWDLRSSSGSRARRAAANLLFQFLIKPFHLLPALSRTSLEYLLFESKVHRFVKELCEGDKAFLVAT